MKRIVIVLGLLFLAAPAVQAQIVAPDPFSQNKIGIELSPPLPRPHQEVRASVNTASVSTIGATIRWYLDGEELTDAFNQRSITVTAGDLGEQMGIRVSVTPGAGAAYEANRIIAPATADLIVEPQTYVPDFYRGRGLPSPYSLIKLTTIVNAADTAELTYLYRVNGQVVGGGGQRNNQFILSTPLGERMTVAVEVYNSRSTLIAQTVVVLPIVKPSLSFYEVNSLKGAVEIPIDESLRLSGSQTTLRAVPYNLDTRVLTSDPLIEWKLNGRVLETDFVHPLDMVISNTFLGANSPLTFHIRNLDNVAQGVRGSISITN